MLDRHPRLHQVLDPRPINGLDSRLTGTLDPLPTRMLDALADAYARGDAPRGERLLVEALDHDLPWDQVCAAAAMGVGRRYASLAGEQAGA